MATSVFDIRSEHRKSVPWRVFQQSRAYLAGQPSIEVKVVDISLGGCGFVSEHTLHVGAALDLSINIQSPQNRIGSHLIHVRGLV